MLALEDQKRWIIFAIAARGTFNFKFWATCHHLSQHAENETKSRKRWFRLACEHRQILGGYLKLFRFMSVINDGANKMQIEEHWVIPQTVPYSIQRNWKQQVLRRTDNRTCKNGKVRFLLNIDIRKEMEDSRLNAIECLKTDYIRKRSTEF